MLDTVDSALVDLKAGRLIVLLDDEDRECEGDLIGAAALVTPDTINFMVTQGRGAFIAAFMPHGRCDVLGIRPMGRRTTRSIKPSSGWRWMPETADRAVRRGTGR